MALVEIAGKPRPAIIVRISEDRGHSLVLCGTGTRRTELAVIEVPESSAAGRALGPSKPTWFYANALRRVRLSHLVAVTGHCPPQLFLQVRLLVEGALLTLSPGELTRDLAEGAAP